MKKKQKKSWNNERYYMSGHTFFQALTLIAEGKKKYPQKYAARVIREFKKGEVK